MITCSPSRTAAAAILASPTFSAQPPRAAWSRRASTVVSEPAAASRPPFAFRYARNPSAEPPPARNSFAAPRHPGLERANPAAVRAGRSSGPRCRAARRSRSRRWAAARGSAACRSPSRITTYPQTSRTPREMVARIKHDVAAIGAALVALRAYPAPSVLSVPAVLSHVTGLLGRRRPLRMREVWNPPLYCDRHQSCAVPERRQISS